MKKKVLIAVALTMMLACSFGFANAAEVVLYQEDFALHPVGVPPTDWNTYAFIDPGTYAEVVVDDVHAAYGNGMELLVITDTDLGYAEAILPMIFGSETATVQFDLWMELSGGSDAMMDFRIVQDELYLELFFDYATNTLYYVSDVTVVPIGVFDFTDYVTVRLEMDFSIDTYDLYIGDMITPVLSDIPLLPGPPSGINYVHFSLGSPATRNEASVYLDNFIITATDPPPVVNPRTGDKGSCQ